MKINKTQWLKATPWFLVSIIIIGLDQWTKALVVHHLQYEKPVQILPFFNLVLRFNRGAAFSLFGQQQGWQVLFLGLISVLVIIFVFFWLLRLSFPDSWTAFALSLLLGGAAGNLIDRLTHSYVTDFLDFHLGGWHYATFNLADSAIVVGVALLLIKTFFRRNS